MMQEIYTSSQSIISVKMKLQLNKMFHNNREKLFGWRKASKCKIFVGNAHHRLQIAKNVKRSFINKMRAEVDNIFKNGDDYQAALQKIEQIIKEEARIKAYDLLCNYCEFIKMKIPYMRKHKDAPSDIYEAVSTIYFSALKVPEVPDLLFAAILFGERYGDRLMSAFKLEPGHLVNQQIIDNLNIQKVSDDVKYTMLNKIAIDTLNELCGNCTETGFPIQTTEEVGTNSSEKHHNRHIHPRLPDYEELVVKFTALKKESTHTKEEIGANSLEQHNRHIHPKLPDYDELVADFMALKKVNTQSKQQISDATRAQEDTVSADPASESKKIPRYPQEQNYPTAMQNSDTDEDDSSLEALSLHSEDITYLDDIQEFVVSTVSKEDEDLQDEKLFKFKSFEEKTDSKNEEEGLSHDTSMSRSSRKMRKSCRKGSTQKYRNVPFDIECATYYGDSD